MKTDEEKTPGLRAAILAGCMVAFLGFGFAATFGVFLTPMSQDLGWGREVFSLSVAVQLLTWGFAQPIAGAVADRFGTARVLAFGAICAGIGFALRGMTTDPTAFGQHCRSLLDPAPPDARRLDPRTGYPPLRRNMVTADSLCGSRQAGLPPDKQKETPCSTNC